MRSVLLLSLPAVLTVTACGDSAPLSLASATHGQSRVVRFVAFGDAGQATQGGPTVQTAVGEAMAEVCAARGCDFALELGDNFYLSGVTSTADSQWQTKFEQPYAALKIPVFATLGNHDNSQGPGEGSANSRGNVQVAYHSAAENVSKKWNMPARYYRFTAPLSSQGNDFVINIPAGYPALPPVAGEPLVEFFSLDSSPLTSIVADPDPRWSHLTYGPTQLQWFQQGLMNSRARWKIAFAHHPYISNGLHGNAGNYDGVDPNLPGTSNGRPWKEFLEDSACAMGLDFFMAGHDHHIEWLTPTASCNDKTQFIISGTAEQPRGFGDANRNPVYYQKANVLAFFWFEFREEEMTGAAYIVDSNTLKLETHPDGSPRADFERTFARQP
ncbi:metallophosphoesterase [Fontimonas thermophila]|nr:metallophosphoesterase [Fontimonas thermophila]